MATVLETILAKLQVKDEASGPLQKISNSAGGIVGKLSGIGSALGGLAGIGAAVGGALTLHGAIESSERYLKNIKEVKELTGATASETDFLFSSARKAGVEYDQMQQIMFSLSKRGAMAAQQMQGIGKGAGGQLQAFKRLGVSMDKGPVSAIEQLSDQVKKGKVGAAELMSNFRIPQGAANDFAEFLEGMDKAKLAQAKAGQIPGLVTDADIGIFDRIEKARHRISDGFNRIKLVIGKELLPVIADMLERFADKLPEWIEGAQKFGKFLNKHLDTAISLAKTLGKVMLANAAIKMLTGGDIGAWIKAGPKIGKGLVEFLGKSPILSMVSTGVGGGAAGSMAMLATALAGVAAVVGVVILAFNGISKNINGVGDRVGALWDTIRSRLEGIAAMFQPIVDWATDLFGGDGTLLGFFEYIAASGVEGVLVLVEQGIHNVQTALMFLAERFQMIGGVLQEAWGSVKDTVSGWADGLTKAIAGGLDKIWNLLPSFIQDGLKKAGVVMQQAGSSIAETSKDAFAYIRSGEAAKDIGTGIFGKQNVADWTRLYNQNTKDAQARTFGRQLERDRAAARLSRGDADAKRREGRPDFDFRGSRFDVTQNFAEGFDPDRIAVAFSNDLAAMGELKTQSGFAPAFAIR